MIKYFNTIYKNKNYEIEVHKDIRYRRITLRYKNEKFIVNAPLFSSNTLILKFVEEKKEKLIKNFNNKLPYDEKGIYILGNYTLFNEGFIELNGKFYLFKDLNNFYKCAKKEYYNFFLLRLRHYEEIMGINVSYSLKIKIVSSIFGSNSYSTHSITLSIKLIHFSIELIDSVIIHELAHHFYRDHSKNFYGVINKYCLNYNECRKKLIHGVYK